MRQAAIYTHSGREGDPVDYKERLRCLAINDERFAPGEAGVHLQPEVLDAKTLSLVRLGALIAVGGAAEPSFGALSDDALDAGATPAEMVDVLVGVLPLVGLPRGVAAAPRLSLALGFDVEAADDTP